MDAVEARLVQGTANGPDASIHHVGGGDDVAAGLSLDDGLPAQDFDGLVIDNISVAEQTIVSVAGVGIQRHVAHHADPVAMRGLDGPNRPADEILGVDRLFGFGRFLLRIRGGKQRNGRNAQFFRFPHGLDEQIQGEPVDARHRRNGGSPVIPVVNEHRPDQIVGRQLLLADQPPRPVMTPVAAHAASSGIDRPARGNLPSSVPPLS